MASALFSTDQTTLVVTVQKPGGELRVTTNAGGPDPIIIPRAGGPVAADSGSPVQPATLPLRCWARGPPVLRWPAAVRWPQVRSGQTDIPWWISAPAVKMRP